MKNIKAPMWVVILGIFLVGYLFLSKVSSKELTMQERKEAQKEMREGEADAGAKMTAILTIGFLILLFKK